jgi:hypothetical protein
MTCGSTISTAKLSMPIASGRAIVRASDPLAAI